MLTEETARHPFAQNRARSDVAGGRLAVDGREDPIDPADPVQRAVLPMTPFCAAYVHLDDPELQAQSRPMYTPYS